MKHDRTITPKAARFFAKRAIIENIPDAKAFAELKAQKKRDDSRFLREVSEYLWDATLFRGIRKAIYKDYRSGDCLLDVRGMRFMHPELHLDAVVEKIAIENTERAKKGGKR